jgi:outer membrane protein assembly factor BamB
MVVLCCAANAVIHAQGRGGGVWTTANGDAQRSAWVRTDPKISKDTIGKGFQFLWKRKLENQPKGLNALTPPIFSAPGFITYKGFKGLIFVGGSSDNIFSIDYDLNRPFWNTHLTTGSSAGGTATCPGGLTTLTRAAAAGPPAAAGRGAPGGGGGGGGRGRGGPDYVSTISSGGMLHSLNPQTGTDVIPPIKVLPANAKVVGSVVVDGVFYAATADACGGAANGVWAVELTTPEKKVTTWETKGGSVVGMAAPSFGTDGTIYVATGAGTSPASNAIVALEPKTLVQKDWFAAETGFASAPVVFQYKGKDAVAAVNSDGRLYLLDSAALGGADHRTPLAKSAPFSSAVDGPLGVSSWQDAGGTRWLLASVVGSTPSGTTFPMSNGPISNGGIVAFTIAEQNGAPSLQAQWSSDDMRSPLPPTIANGVVFAIASGEVRAGTVAQRVQRSVPAVLYALDAVTGKQLWTSGTTITSFARGGGPAVNDSQVYVLTYDGTLYAFGFVTER